MKLSIVIPYWNAEPYTSELLDRLAPQMRRGVECVVIDDGSPEPFKTDYKWCKVYRKKNGGAATARNMGMDKTTGEYLSFIDADDLVPEYFVERLLKKIEESHADVIDFSWKSLNKEGSQHNVILKSDDDWLSNPSVCTRAFKRSFIGENRFNEKKDCTEDEDFSRKCGYLDHDGDFKHASISEYMYFYRTAVTNSKFKRFKAGTQKTKRIAYYYRHVTEDMRWLLEEVKREDEVHEVYVITNQCDIPEMKRYARVINPQRIWAHYLRGEPFTYCQIIPIPIKADIVIYYSNISCVSGVTTSTYNFIQNMKDTHSIFLIYDAIDEKSMQKFRGVVDLRQNDKSDIQCDTLIMERLSDKIPTNIRYNKVIQMCHACKHPSIKMNGKWDILINVSESAKKSWGNEAKEGVVIKNFSYKEPDELLLVSATRIRTADKGENEARFKKLANMLNEKGIKYTWLNFSDYPLGNMPSNFINMGARADIQNFIKRADYLVQLSDKEACPMVVIEALMLDTPILSTPYESLFELGFKDGKHGYVIPFDMNFDVNKLREIPHYTGFKYDNEALKEKWEEVLSRQIETREVKVMVLKDYRDMQLNQMLHQGQQLYMDKARAYELANHKEKLVKIIE